MLWEQVPQRHHAFVVERRPELSIVMCHTSYLVHGSGWLHPPTPDVSISQASFASAETSASAAEPFW